MYRFYGIFLGAIEVHSGTFSAEGTANVTCKIGLSTLSEICGSCSLHTRNSCTMDIKGVLDLYHRGQLYVFPEGTARWNTYNCTR